MTKEQVSHAGVVLLRHAASAMLLLGLLYSCAKPHAQTFIEEAVEDRLNLLEMQMNDVRQSSRDMQREQAIMSNDIANMQEIQKDTKRDTRMILQSMQGLRRELRED
jgi:septal ring factor EnvC (AmiA/AmiB activator)